jgi:YHS domain-containing protein
MSQMAEDPVCGMWVDSRTALFSEFEGENYYFCSQDCKQEFDDDPDRYVGWGGTSRSGSA